MKKLRNQQQKREWVGRTILTSQQEAMPLVVMDVVEDHAQSAVWLNKNKALRLDLFGGSVLSLY